PRAARAPPRRQRQVLSGPQSVQLDAVVEDYAHLVGGGPLVVLVDDGGPIPDAQPQSRQRLELRSPVDLEIPFVLDGGRAASGGGPALREKDGGPEAWSGARGAELEVPCRRSAIS